VHTPFCSLNSADKMRLGLASASMILTGTIPGLRTITGGGLPRDPDDPECSLPLDCDLACQDCACRDIRPRLSCCPRCVQWPTHFPRTNTFRHCRGEPPPALHLSDSLRY